ncbi:Glutathione hydrolase-like YwrD proenzyme [Pseudomonas fluorescens]|nr:Glutathione hydrolase-like YwrD proenzyme [Pseudomonas fluorescens]
MSFRTQAHGRELAMATPHYLAGCFALNSFIAQKNTHHAATVALFSAAFNLPHLCGLGGDAIILAQSPDGEIQSYNGMGITGSNQSIEYYRAYGFSAIPSRGLFSTMIYGAAYALQEFMDCNDLDLREVLRDLAADINKPIPVSPCTYGFINKYRKDIVAAPSFQNWRQVYLEASAEVKNSVPHASRLVSIIRREGLRTFYSGSIAHRFLDRVNSEAPGLFLPEDFESFKAPRFDVANINFLGSSIHCHAGNAPWLEMAIILGVVERRIAEYARFNGLTMLRWCRLAGAVESFLEQRGIDRCLAIDPNDLKFVVSEAISAIESEIESCTLIKPIWGKGADTVFIGSAHADGTLIGMTSSIFTPFGAMLDPGESGLLLSNRAFSFSDDPLCSRRLEPNKTANHTINSLIVRSSDMDFTMGTTGGFVQVQILVQLLVRILYLKEAPQAALEAPRFANMGKSNRYQGTLICYEKRNSSTVPESFVPLPALCGRMGVAQIAGILKSNGDVFSASDPRGEGAALAY